MKNPILTSLYAEYPNNVEVVKNQRPKKGNVGQVNRPDKAGLQSDRRQSTYVKLVQKSVSQRQSIEQFVQQQYKQHFDAEIHHFFPILISVYQTSNDELMGTVGIRYADLDDLFSEQYLTKPVEQILTEQSGRLVSRSSVIELGHFALAQRRNLVSVVHAIAQFISQLKVEWAVYTLSQPMVKAITRLNIPTQFLGSARAEKLRDQDSRWGQYYQFKPAVYCSHTATALDAIACSGSSYVAH